MSPSLVALSLNLVEVRDLDLTRDQCSSRGILVPILRGRSRDHLLQDRVIALVLPDFPSSSGTGNFILVSALRALVFVITMVRLDI